MEECEGNLKKYLKGYLDLDLDLDLNLNLDTYACLFYQLINGMDYLRSLEIIHCDIKLENLLISNDGKLKICDFGCSFYLDKAKEHFGGNEQVAGSKIYLPPEALNEGIKYNNFNSDLWACGIVLYNMLTNNSFDKGISEIEDLKKRHKNIEKFIDETTKDIEDAYAIDLLKNMLKLNPEDRITIEGIKKHDFYIRGEKKYKELYKVQ